MWLLIVSLSIFPYLSLGKCAYESCSEGDSGKINVHLIAHTHDDVGWLKTVDEYYYGRNNSIQRAGVQYILDSVILALEQDSGRRFSYVEMAFFHQWWLEQTESKKQDVIRLVNQGRLEFLLGGWSMNDEAAAHYTAIIDQLTLGLDFLNQTFGSCGRPKVAWQIDPFGHSIEQANIFDLIGYDVLFFSRLDYRDRAQRISEKRMEFLQKTHYLRAPKNGHLFTSIMYNGYCTPNNFCFDEECSDEPIIDNPQSVNYNIKSKVSDFVNQLDSISRAYSTNHILVTMGCDFQFQNALQNFKNIDKLIKYVNKYSSKYNLMYSTPACYTRAVNNANQTYTTKRDDFFPYASDAHTYWTGYFTSRPSTKGFIRSGNAIYQHTKKIYVQSELKDRNLSRLVQGMGKEMGILQHHDSVTGTEKQHVTYDYMRRLMLGVNGCEQVIDKSLQKLMSTNDLRWTFCTMLNVSYCAFTDKIGAGESLMMVLYNSLEQSVNEWTRIPVYVGPGELKKYVLIEGENKTVKFDFIPITNRTRSIPERPPSAKANYELVFESIVPAFGYVTYTLKKSRVQNYGRVKESRRKKMNLDDFSVENKYYRLKYEGGYLKNVKNLKSGVAVNLKQQLSYYLSNGPSKIRNSGAYIFKPKVNQLMNCSKVEVEVVRGDLVQEVHQKFEDWLTLVTRLYSDRDQIENEWTVGPIPIQDSVGREVVWHVDLDLDSEGMVVTDSNGRQLITRRVNERSDYKFNQTESIAGNYYPIDSSAIISDKSGQRAMMVLTDRAQGGGSYQTGMLQLMLHRRCLYDDNFGVGEALNETGIDGKGLVVRGKHYLSFDTLPNLINRRRSDALVIFNKPLIMFSQLTNNKKGFIKSYTGFQYDNFPEGLHILSMENHFNTEMDVDYKIVRLENILQDDKELSVNLCSLLTSWMIVDRFEELNLGANQKLNEMTRLKWREKNGPIKLEDIIIKNQSNNCNVLIGAGEIKTFRIYTK